MGYFAYFLSWENFHFAVLPCHFICLLLILHVYIILAYLFINKCNIIINIILLILLNIIKYVKLFLFLNNYIKITYTMDYNIILAICIWSRHAIIWHAINTLLCPSVYFLLVVLQSTWNTMATSFQSTIAFTVNSNYLVEFVKRLFKVTRGDRLINSNHFQKAINTFTQKRLNCNELMTMAKTKIGEIDINFKNCFE